MNTPNNQAPRTVSSRGGRFRNNRKVGVAPAPLENDMAPNKDQHVQRQNPNNNKPSPKSSQGRTGPHNSNRKSKRRSTGRSRKGQNHQLQRNNLQPSPEEQSKYLALDCEMVGIGPDGLQSALARVVVIDWSGSILLDKFVRVDQPITDYRTFVSGITAQDLQSDNAITYDECRGLVATMLRGKILVGHALKNDLAALGIHHPWQDTRDTAKYEPFMKTRFDDGVLWPRKLRDLVKERLGRDIQVAGQWHSPIEDAMSALELYKCVRTKWEKCMDYKVKKTNDIMRQQKQTAAVV
mmetsp:Transcript_12263/g.25994  ORF Transcript_12263/g.25994 Transcript_12263/m.25994 type:complete len:295 (-) Transcript_12263:171-1055(-)